MNDVTDAFKGWLEKIIIQKPAPGNYVNGRWVEDSTKETDVPIYAVVQNALPNELIVLPEGLRTSEAVKIHTTYELIPTSETDQVSGDKFAYNGKNWQVYSVAERVIGNYNKGIAVRI